MNDMIPTNTNKTPTTAMKRPEYEPDPQKAPHQMPELTPAEIYGYPVSHEDAYNLTRIFLARVPCWTLYNEKNRTRPGCHMARLYLTHPGQITPTAFVLVAATQQEKEALKQFFTTNFVDFAPAPDDPIDIETNYIPPEFA